MKCEHGIEIQALIEKASPPYWDDGIISYNRDGTPVKIAEETFDNERHLRVSCLWCRVIKYNTC